MNEPYPAEIDEQASQTGEPPPNSSGHGMGLRRVSGGLSHRDPIDFPRLHPSVVSPEWASAKALN